MNKQKGFTLVELLALIIVVLGVGGWIANIYKLMHTIADPITGLFVLRAIGVVVAPLGSVLGFF